MGLKPSSRWCFTALVSLAVLLGLSGNVAAVIAPSPYHPSRILILPREGVPMDRLSALHAETGCRILRTLPGQGGLQVLALPEGESVPAMVERYASSGVVAFAESDYQVSAAVTLANDPRFKDGTLWALNNYGQEEGIAGADIDAPLAWDISRSSTNVIVAVVDSGIRYTHQDLRESLWVNPEDGSFGYNALNDDHDPWDEAGHGTHVAGIIGAAGNNGVGVTGVAWQARIMACKFLDARGDGYNSDAATCIEFARINGASIVNLSWGGSAFSAAISNAIWSAQSDGMIFVAAAGNTGRNIDLAPYYPASLDLDNIISVGASTRNDDRWPSSNYGTESVDLFAPGADIYSAWSGGNREPYWDSDYRYKSGTSMATAYVSGAVAVLLNQRPGLPCQETIDRLFASVDSHSAYWAKCRTSGRLNLRKMIDQPGVHVDPPASPVQVRVTGVPGHTYSLLGTTNLHTWSPLATGVADHTGEWVFTDPDSTNLPARFFRATPSP